MRKSELPDYYAGECKKVIDPYVFEILSEGMRRKTNVYFDYLRKDGTLWRYRRMIPESWLFLGKCYLYARHELHGTMHTFRAWAISLPFLEDNIVNAIIDMNKYSYVWSGEVYIIGTEKL